MKFLDSPRSLFLRLSFGIGWLWLAGCATTSHYKAPDVATPTQWQNNSSAPITNPATPPQPASPTPVPATPTPLNQAPQAPSWWTLYNDPELNALEQQALANNFNARAAVSRVEEARATVRNATSYRTPEVTLNPSVYKSHLSALRPVQFPNATVIGISQQQFYIPINVNYEVDVWGRIRSNVRAAETDQQAAEADVRVVQLTLTTDAASYYFTIRGLDADLGVLDSTRQARVQNLQLVQSRFKAGVDNEIGVRRAETELANVDASRIEVQRQRAGYVAALATVCGQPASSFTVAPRPTVLVAPTVPTNVPTTLLARRPDLQRAERQLAAADARIDAARLARRPTVLLNGYIGPQSAQFSEIARLNESYTYYLGGTLGIPIFNGGRLRSNQQLAEARFNTATASYQQSALTAFQEVETALADVQQSAAQLEAQQRALRSARLAGLLTRERYNRGLTNYFEVVDADRQTLEAARLVVQTQADQLRYSVNLVKALGGGWE
ncbi:efflux transporter outer membrane subunit [Hymenobacter sp. GOD-10R]|uniref:efflux transporter outer membrane subunit n=1 Tax=Hymenobacter sp. GOD-10R TaxID=3093922 RepID=UPI002D78F9E2|nr:efflux transporter outer membrane subunit [Hymenobacter sp. GOD-10R]WRQ30566.1 efflux transporter outer membrane subunit [Hymenobacter sp. GOD-10R]